jgi:hypothetical protein
VRHFKFNFSLHWWAPPLLRWGFSGESGHWSSANLRFLPTISIFHCHF